jgi:ribosomal protein L37AE/L43A
MPFARLHVQLAGGASSAVDGSAERVSIQSPFASRAGAERREVSRAAMTHPWPKEIAVDFCQECSRVDLARRVNRENEIPIRYCSHCGKPLAVSVYTRTRELTPVAIGPGKPRWGGP